MKRPLDIVGAAVLLCLLSPLMLLVAMAVAATSRGPVIFKQTRMGQGCLPFTFYKFRSMTLGRRPFRPHAVRSRSGKSSTGQDQDLSVNTASAGRLQDS